MQTKLIVVEFRPPKNKSEKKLYGCTETENDVTKIFLNETQDEGEMVNTFFHELAHTYIQWSGTKLTPLDEERICRLVGNVAEPCFRKYKL